MAIEADKVASSATSAQKSETARDERYLIADAVSEDTALLKEIRTKMWQRIRARASDNSNYALLFSVKAMLSLGFHFFMKIMGPVLVILANILILIIMYLYFSFLLPVVAGEDTFTYFLHASFAIFMVSNILFNYVSCVTTPPGSPAPVDDPTIYLKPRDVEAGSSRVNYARLELEVAPYVKYRYCTRCRSIKPPRAHHDSLSGKCVFHMDHYCPWMANCIGYNNYRYFFLFLLYMFIGCVYAVAITTRPFLSLPQEQRRMHLQPSYRSAVTFTFMITLSIAISVGILLVWHIFLVLTNQTTIEYHINQDHRYDASLQGEIYRNPFDQGIRKNLCRVFGDGPLLLALLPNRRPPPPPEHPWLPPIQRDGRRANDNDSDDAPLLDGKPRQASRRSHASHIV